MATPSVKEFKELKKDSLIQLGVNDSSTELWLVQWPFDHDKTNTPWPKLAEFNGQEATFKLNSDVEFGNIQSSSGKSYELRSMQSYTPEEVVILSSASDTKIVGKISRHVSLVHYPEPSELQKPDIDLARKLGQGSFATSLTGSVRRTATPTQTIRPRHSNPNSGKRGSSSIIPGSLESSKSRKRKHSNDASGSRGHSNRDSGRGHSTVTSSGGSLNQSEERKSKKKRKTESTNDG